MEPVKRTKFKLTYWLAEVDRLMKRDWCIDIADAGISAGDLARYWQNGAEPFEFVEWFAEKYDLIRFERC